jgi:Raf kinase inhibitor-like YbhB/YbcL family protein
MIPALYTCGGADSSPPLEWSGAPAGTQGFALVLADPDAPGGTFYHWAIYDLPPTVTSLPAHYPPETRDHIRQALNDFGRRGYGGPCPPAGPAHHYHFTLYALSVGRLVLATVPPHCADVETAVRQTALARAELIGRYGR